MRYAAPSLLAVLALAGCATPQARQPAGSAFVTSGPDAAELAAIRRETERFRDVRVALAEGYLRDPMDMCVVAEAEGAPRQLGGMGIHYFRPDLLGITATAPRVAGTGVHTDFLRPGVLIYEPQADGSLELVAVENLVFARAWKDAGHTGPPSFRGQDYYLMIDNPYTEVDEAHGFEPHYELHLWLYRDNPAGAFAPFNARVSCRHHRTDAEHAAHAAPMPHVTTGHTLVTPDGIVWRDASSLAPGAQIAYLEGDPKEAAPFTFRIRLPANARLGVHTHPTEERVTVLSGTFHLGIGDTFDESRARALTPGSVAIMPRGMPMYAFTRGETVIQLHGIGPWGVTYLDRGSGGTRE